MKISFCFAWVFVSFACSSLVISDVLYVRADAVNDPNQDGTFNFPFGTIQAAVDQAGDDTIIILPGTYLGSVVVTPNGRQSIRLMSEDPDDWAVIDNTKIESNQGTPIFSITCDPNLGVQNFTCEIRGFTLSGGVAEKGAAIYSRNVIFHLAQSRLVSNRALSEGGGIYIKDGGGTIKNCILSGNRAENGSAVYGENSFLKMHNCTLTGNCSFSADGAAIYFADCDSVDSVSLQNNILWRNKKKDIGSRNSIVDLQYNNIEGGYKGLGNISKDPRFVSEGFWSGDPNTPEDPNNVWQDGDYHLLSRGWRFDPRSGQWTWDSETSPCLDSGNPGTLLGDEPMNLAVDPQNKWGCNKRINMGVYGGACQASIPPHNWALLSDLTNDGTVDIEDLSEFVLIWRSVGKELYSDFNRDDNVDLVDFALMNQDWNDKTSWRD
jgi:parallel beta-helix repeat protein